MRRRKTPYDVPAGPVALDPASGFKVPHKDLEKQWDGEWIDKRFLDRRNPQDLIRTRPDKPNLPHPRPEPADRFVSTPILWEDLGYMLHETGDAIFGEGIHVSPELL